MNLIEANLQVKDFHARTALHEDAAYQIVCKNVDLFMDMLCQHYPTDIDAVQLLKNIAGVAKDQGDIKIVIMITGILFILGASTSC